MQTNPVPGQAALGQPRNSDYPAHHPPYAPSYSQGQHAQEQHSQHQSLLLRQRFAAEQAAAQYRATELNPKLTNSYGPIRPAQQSHTDRSKAQRAIARRYRHDLDEDFVPNFGRTLNQNFSQNQNQNQGQGLGRGDLIRAEEPGYLRRLRETSQPPVSGLARSQIAPAPQLFSQGPTVNWQNWPIANMRFWTALGGIIFAAVMLNVLSSSPVVSSIIKSRDRRCQEIVQSTSVLSRQQLTQLLTVPERSPRADIQSIIQEPYCTLPSISIRAGVSALREAYPLEFDPETWIVLLYEGDEYAGYRFDAR